MKFLLVIVLTFVQMAHAETESVAPGWFSDYVKNVPGCDREFLCAVGDAETLADALSEARTEIAKYFQTKINSKSQYSASSKQNGLNPSLGSFDEWTNKTVSMETVELINGLEIKNQERRPNGHTYVLMTLNRAKTASLLKEKIEELDTQNTWLLEKNSRFSYPKILKNLIQIDQYNERYSLVSDSTIKLKVKKETLQTKINNLTVEKMALVTRGKKLPSKLNHILIDLLSPLKIVVVQSKQSPSFTLRGEVVTEEQYFKVEGFKKLNIVYKLELLNAKSEVVGKLSALSEQVARNIDQGVEKALPDIKEYLLENLEQLSPNLK